MTDRIAARERVAARAIAVIFAVPIGPGFSSDRVIRMCHACHEFQAVTGVRVQPQPADLKANF